MYRVLWNARSTMMANQDKLDCIANNIANSQTTGYKSTETSFRDLVYETLKRKGYPVSDGAGENTLTGTGVRTGDWLRNNAQGALRQTFLSTDLALDGPGYFAVTTSNGQTAYARSGEFGVDASGNVVDSNGNKLQIQLTQEGNDLLRANGGFRQDTLVVKSDGRVSLKTKDGTMEVGQINIYDAVGNDGMTSIGDNMYVPSAGATVYQVKGTKIYQGYLENSNVDMAKEMTEMITTQRAFELGSRGLKTADEMYGMINNLKSK